MWTLTGSLTNALSLRTATLLPNGKVLMAGGSDNNDYGNASAAAQLYDPTTGTWTGNKAMGNARYAHTATLLPNGMVLVVGEPPITTTQFRRWNCSTDKFHLDHDRGAEFPPLFPHGNFTGQRQGAGHRRH